MEVQNFIEKLKNFQSLLLQYLDDKQDIEEKYQNLIYKIFQTKICSNKDDFRLLLRMIYKIAKNHHQLPTFFNKIFNILTFLKGDIKQTFSNLQIFKIFKKSKRILLFLIEEKILIIDKSIADIMIGYRFECLHYKVYFFPEIRNFLEKSMIQKIAEKIPENFEKKRKIGQNDNYICELIRNDSIDEFIEFVNKNNISIDSNISSSIFETNNFILHKIHYGPKPTLIEYAAFFGSINIFKYLYSNKAKTREELLIYSIHGANNEMIHIVESIEFKKKKKRRFGYSYKDSDDSEGYEDEPPAFDYFSMSYFHFEEDDEPKETTRDKCLEEAFKCHHNEIAVYIIDNWGLKTSASKMTSFCFRYFNFLLIQDAFNKNVAFYNCCRYEYNTLVNLLINTTGIDVNAKTILNFKLMKLQKKFII